MAPCQNKCISNSIALQGNTADVEPDFNNLNMRVKCKLTMLCTMSPFSMAATVLVTLLSFELFKLLLVTDKINE